MEEKVVAITKDYLILAHGTKYSTENLTAKDQNVFLQK